jgi:radical SAM protein with 4Fe4S-binding SPASM domain
MKPKFHGPHAPLHADTAEKSFSPRFQRVYVEITNICNLRCRFCVPPSRPAAVMEPDFFAAVLQKVRSLTDEICLHVLGEPLTHPQFPLLLEICAQAGLHVNLTTNAVLLGRRQETILEAAPIRQINFSLHALVQEKNPNMKTLADVLNFCRASLNRRPDLYVNLRLWNLDSPTALQEDADWILKRIAEELRVDAVQAPPGRKSRRLLERIYLHQDTKFSWPGTTDLEKREHGYCHALRTHCAILVDGTVCPCCLDAGGRLALGNIRHATLEEILNGPRAVAMYNGFGRGKLVEPLCQTCDFCRRFKKVRQPNSNMESR